MAKALITGAAGFIGSHLAARLLDDGWDVVGLDGMSTYYDVDLKKARLELIEGRDGYTHVEGRIDETGVLTDLMAAETPDVVVHLAAEAGVRHSIEDPRLYVNSNVMGTFELLEAARAHPPKHLLMASTSSAYGANTEMPYAETMKADWPVSFYAATKKATETLAHSHSHIYGLPVTMFRFFTVYGPWGRPDMAYYLFTDAILNGRPIKVFNHGQMHRDFVYVDDLVEAIIRLFDAVPERPGDGETVPDGDSLSPVAPFRVVNIGKSAPDTLMEFIEAIEKATGIEAEKDFMEMQKGDVVATWADASLLKTLTGYLPDTPLEKGIGEFVTWYKAYHGKN